MPIYKNVRWLVMPMAIKATAIEKKTMEMVRIWFSSLSFVALN